MNNSDIHLLATVALQAVTFYGLITGLNGLAAVAGLLSAATGTLGMSADKTEHLK